MEAELAAGVNELSPEQVKSVIDPMLQFMASSENFDPNDMQEAIAEIVSLNQAQGVWINSNEKVKASLIENLGMAGTPWEDLINEAYTLEDALNIAAIAASGISPEFVASTAEARALQLSVIELGQSIKSIPSPGIKPEAAARLKRGGLPEPIKPEKEDFVDPYEKQKKAIEDKIDSIKDEIDAIKDKQAAEKKAFDAKKRQDDYDKRMRDSAIGYREALAAGEFGQAALIKNSMNADKAEFENESKQINKDDKFDKQIKSREDAVEGLNDQLDTLKDKTEAAKKAQDDAFDAAMKKYDAANKAATGATDRTQAVTKAFDKAWGTTLEGLADGTIQTADDMEQKIGVDGVKAIKDGGYAVDEFFKKAQSSALGKIVEANTNLGKTAAQLVAGGATIAEAMRMLDEVVYLVGQGASTSGAKRAVTAKTPLVSFERDDAGNIINWGPRAPYNQDYVNRALGFGGAYEMPSDKPLPSGKTDGPLNTGLDDSQNNYPFYNTRSGFTALHGGHHAGLDFEAPTGTPIFAARKGRVITSKDTATGFGSYVVLEDGGLKFAYAHMSKRIAKVGQVVSEGTQLGLVGNSGTSSGSHVHYEVRPSATNFGNANWATAKDPRRYMHTGGLVAKLNSDETMRILQHGEYVMQKSAVDRVGPAVMGALNAGRLPQVANSGSNQYNFQVYGAPGQDIKQLAKEVRREFDIHERRKGGKRD
jgi:murein DD-endopeptidase MepM/ murein hydrolase activator NlpD